MRSKCFYFNTKLIKFTLRKVSTIKLAKEFLRVSTDKLWKAQQLTRIERYIIEVACSFHLVNKPNIVRV